MKGRKRLLWCVLCLVLGAGCASSDSGKTDFVFNPGALTFTRLTTNTGGDTYPVWNPAGDRLAFVATRSGHPEVWAWMSESDQRQLTSGEREIVSRPSWSPDGQSLVFAADFPEGKDLCASDVRLWVVSYLWTLPNLELLTEGAVTDGWPAWSPDGATILFTRADTLRTIPSGGGDIQTFATPGLDGAPMEPAWSPDGQTVAFTVFDGHDYDIYLESASGGSPRALVTTGANERSPAWSPGGAYIAFQSDGAGNWDIWVIGSGGGKAENLTGSSAFQDVQPSWDPQGGRIAFCSNRTGNDDLWVIEEIPFLD